jgi:hypothetical protein
VYCGNLPDDVREGEVEDLFYKYGRIRVCLLLRCAALSCVLSRGIVFAIDFFYETDAVCIIL